MPRIKKIPRHPLFWAFLASLLFVHLPLLLWFAFWSDSPDLAKALPSPQNAPVVTVNLAPRPLPAVDIDKPARQEKPDKPSAQALYNSKVREETTARGTPHKKPGSPGAFAKLPERTPAAKKAPSKSPARTAKQDKKLSNFKKAPLPAPSAEKPKTLKEELMALRGEQRAKESKSLERFASKTAQPLPTSFGSGGGFDDDFLPQYKVGDRTYVNALANPQIGYYVELKRKFKLTWNPAPSIRAQINQISRGKIAVVLGVSLDESGKLSDIVLIRGSGIAAYDAEARRTIASSAPFSRPPGNLLAPDGQMHMAWTFVVYL